jgi:hypothetical protein
MLEAKVELEPATRQAKGAPDKDLARPAAAASAVEVLK